MKWKEIKNLIKEELKGSVCKNCKNENCTCPLNEVTPTWEVKDGKCYCNGGLNQTCHEMTNKTDCRRCCADVTGKTKFANSAEKLKEASITAKDTQFNLRTGVNKNPTKLGIKIQFEPSSGAEMDRDTKAALEISLQEKLNDSLKQYGIQVSKDTDVPRPNVIGFFIPLAQIKNLIVEALGGKAEEPAVPAPEPEATTPAASAAPAAPAAPVAPVAPSPEQMVNEQLINEMRVRDLNEISKVVIKEDFYSFINAGNNILRTLEENGIPNGKNYIKYLTKHNIM